MQPFLPEFQGLLSQVYAAMHQAEMPESVRGEVDELLLSYALDRQDVPHWPIDLFQSMLSGRRGLTGFSEHSDCYNGGALLAVFTELSPLMRWHWRNEGEYASLHCPRLPSAAVFQFEGSSQYCWTITLISAEEVQDHWAFRAPLR